VLSWVEKKTAPCVPFEFSVSFYLEFSIQKSSPVSAFTLSRRSASSSIWWQNSYTAFYSF
jgi:hypothetical protein